MKNKIITTALTLSMLLTVSCNGPTNWSTLADITKSQSNSSTQNKKINQRTMFITQKINGVENPISIEDLESIEINGKLLKVSNIGMSRTSFKIKANSTEQSLTPEQMFNKSKKIVSEMKLALEKSIKTQKEIEVKLNNTQDQALKEKYKSALFCSSGSVSSIGSIIYNSINDLDALENHAEKNNVSSAEYEFRKIFANYSSVIQKINYIEECHTIKQPENNNDDDKPDTNKHDPSEFDNHDPFENDNNEQKDPKVTQNSSGQFTVDFTADEFKNFIMSFNLTNPKSSVIVPYFDTLAGETLRAQINKNEKGEIISVVTGVAKADGSLDTTKPYVVMENTTDGIPKLTLNQDGKSTIISISLEKDEPIIEKNQNPSEVNVQKITAVNNFIGYWIYNGFGKRILLEFRNAGNNTFSLHTTVGGDNYVGTGPYPEKVESLEVNSTYNKEFLKANLKVLNGNQLSLTLLDAGDKTLLQYKGLPLTLNRYVQ